MKILLLALPVLFSSCTQYQYLTIDSDDTQENKKKEFQFENDDVRITYNFFGANAPIEVKVYNKSSKGLNVDWSKSSLIIYRAILAQLPDEYLISNLIVEHLEFQVVYADHQFEQNYHLQVPT